LATSRAPPRRAAGNLIAVIPSRCKPLSGTNRAGRRGFDSGQRRRPVHQLLLKVIALAQEYSVREIEFCGQMPVFCRKAGIESYQVLEAANEQKIHPQSKTSDMATCGARTNEDPA